MAQEGPVDGLAVFVERLDRALEVNGVPQNDSGNDEVESARAVSLVLEAAIADLAEAVEKDGALQGMFCFAFVEPSGDTPRSSTSCSQSKVKSVRSICPISRIANAKPFWRG